MKDSSLQFCALCQKRNLAPAHKVLDLSSGECSTAVAALIALISPLPYSADFRPYFTIHDPDYQAMTLPDQAPSNSKLPRLLGVTNRYFLKVCSPACLPLGKCFIKLSRFQF